MAAIVVLAPVLKHHLVEKGLVAREFVLELLILERRLILPLAGQRFKQPQLRARPAFLRSQGAFGFSLQPASRRGDLTQLLPSSPARQPRLKPSDVLPSSF